jgi:hypothetical protein
MQRSPGSYSGGLRSPQRQQNQLRNRHMVRTYVIASILIILGHVVQVLNDVAPTLIGFFLVPKSRSNLFLQSIGCHLPPLEIHECGRSFQH